MQNIDLWLVEELRKDARKSNVKLAKKLGISEGSVRNHISALLKKGIIKKFTIELGLKTDFRTITLVTTKSGYASSAAVNSLKKLKGIEDIYEVSGSFDIVIETRADSPNKYNELIEKIRSLKGIESTETLVVLESH